MSTPASSPSPYDTTGGPVQQKRTLSILALVFGIIGIIGSFFGLLGLLFPILAVVFGFLGRSRERHARGLWLTGLILGFVAIALAIIFTIIGAIALAAMNQGTTP